MGTTHNLPINTERLVIRPFDYSDIRAFRVLVTEDPDHGWYNQAGNIEGFLGWHIAKYEKMDVVNDIVCLGIFDGHSGQVLGAVGVGKHDDLDETEVFYRILQHFTGNGYATEAAIAVTGWAFRCFGLSYIVGTTGLQNRASQRVLEKCGYQYVDERYLRNNVLAKTLQYRYYRCKNPADIGE